MVGVQELPDVEKKPNSGSMEIEEQLELFADLLVELIVKNEE
jgi:hypothetical protein